MFGVSACRRVGGLKVHKFSPSEDDIALVPSV